MKTYSLRHLADPVLRRDLSAHASRSRGADADFLAPARRRNMPRGMLA